MRLKIKFYVKLPASRKTNRDNAKIVFLGDLSTTQVKVKYIACQFFSFLPHNKNSGSQYLA